MIYNVDSLSDFRIAKFFKSYLGLCEFLKRFPESYYIKNNIYFEKHRIGSKQEGYTYEETLYIPVAYHFKLHMLKAKESLNRMSRLRNLKEASNVIGREYNRKELYLIEMLWSDDLYHKFLN